MPYTVQLKSPLHGISGETFETEESGKFLVEGFLTDKDGESFYNLLKVMERTFLQPFSAQGFHVSQIIFGSTLESVSKMK